MTKYISKLSDWMKIKDQIETESCEVFKYVRKSFNLTQAELAIALDITNVHVSNIENRKSIPSLELLKKLNEFVKQQKNKI